MIKQLIAVAAIAFASPSMAQNLIGNGGFEAGNTGFTTSYNYVAPFGDMIPENTYTVGTNAANQHPSWANITAIEGLSYFIANGSSVNDAPAWSQSLAGLVIGQTYNFSAYAVNICCNASFNGPNASPLLITVGTSGTPTTIATSGALGTTGTWTQFTGSFVATSSITTLSIFTDSNALSGNDFGLDAISLTAAVPEPATWAMMLLGFGFVGAAIRRRRRSIAVATA